MSNELQMIVLASRMEMTSDQIALLRALIEGADRPQVLRLATVHGVRPLVLRNLEAHCSDLLEDDSLTPLRSARRSIVAKAMQQTAELDRISTLLRAEGIPLFPYKGIALGELLYGDAALRESGDIDIIVPKAQAMDAVAVLCASGYRPLYALSSKQERVYVEGGNHYNLSHVDKSINLEVHWDIITPHHGIRIPWQTFWDQHRSQLLTLNQRSLDSDPEFLLLLLLLHGGKHRWEALKWLVDVVQCIQHYPSLRWEELLQQAKALRVERLVLSGLNLASSLYAVALPVEVQQRITANSGVRALSAEVLSVLEKPWAVDGATDIGYQLRMRDRWQDRVRYGWRIVTMLNFQDVDSRDIEDDDRLPRYEFLQRGVRILSKRGVGPTAQLLVQMVVESTKSAQSRKSDP